MRTPPTLQITLPSGERLSLSVRDAWGLSKALEKVWSGSPPCGFQHERCCALGE